LTKRQAAWVQTVTADQLPPAPIRLGYMTVLDPAKWLHRIQREALQGLNGARERYGAVTADILLIQNLIEGDMAWE